MTATSPLRWFGSKGLLAGKVTGLLPDHDHYVEVFGGSGAVLFSKVRSRVETFNDLDGDVANLFRVLRDEQLAERLARLVELTPFSRSEWESCRDSVAAAITDIDVDVERARAFLVTVNQSIARTPHRTGWASLIARPTGSSPSTRWTALPPKIVTASSRLTGVQIECQEWEVILARFDKPGVVFYVDPPYPQSLRAGTYRVDMNDQDHERLVAALRNLRHAEAVVSGYSHPLYEPLESGGWGCHQEMAAADDHGRGRRDRVETLWCSPGCQSVQASLFDSAAG